LIAGLTIDPLADLYQSKVTSLLDKCIPAKIVTIWQHPSVPWFDQDYSAPSYSWNG